MKYQVNFNEQEKDELLIFMHAESFHEAITEYLDYLSKMKRESDSRKTFADAYFKLIDTLENKHLGRFFYKPD